MKALTVQQPWAWAILHGGKNIENRTQHWSYRGPLAIHAGLQISYRGTLDPHLRLAFGDYVDPGQPDGGIPPGYFVTGAFIGVVDLVDVHHAHALAATSSCCEPWGDNPVTHPRAVHLVLENPRPIALPIPARGALGLWTPDPYDVDELMNRAGL